jgi:hypothetical protein
MKIQEIDNVMLVSAKYLHDYVIRFVFNNGNVHDLDFYPFLSKVPQNPMTSKYLKKDLFKKFKTNKHGDISWNDREMCYDFFTTYYGFKDAHKMERLYEKNTPAIRTVYL